MSVHALQVDVELAADQVNERHPGQSQHHHHTGHDSPEADQLPLGRIRFDFLVEIESDQGRSGVEHGTHGTHQCSKQCRDHQAHQTSGEQVDDESRISNVTVQHFPIRAKLEQIAVEGYGNQAGQYQHEHGQNLEKASEDGCRFRVAFILGGEHTLYDHLIGAPVPDPEYGRSKKYSGPRKIGIAGRLDHVEIAGGHGYT